ANPRLTDQYSLTMDNTVRRAFSRCVTDITGYRDGLENLVYLCGKPSSKDPVAGLYRDDTTRVTVDGYLSALNGTTEQDGTWGRISLNNEQSGIRLLMS